MQFFYSARACWAGAVGLLAFLLVAHLAMTASAQLQFTDASAETNSKHTSRLIAVNTVGLKSNPSAESVAEGVR